MVKTGPLTEKQLEWVDWAILGLDINGGSAYADSLAWDLDCTVERAQAILDAQEQCRIENKCVVLPDPSRDANEVVSDIGYALLTQSASMGETPAERAQHKAAENAWEKIKAAYLAAGGDTIDQIVYCLGDYTEHDKAVVARWGE